MRMNCKVNAYTIFALWIAASPFGNQMRDFVRIEVPSTAAAHVS